MIHHQHHTPNLPPKYKFNCMLFPVHHGTSLKLSHILFLIQKRGSRKGSIEIKKIRCVEKVNLEEQTPVERQYPFQVKGGTTLLWVGDSPNNIFLMNPYYPGKMISQNYPGMQ